MIEVIDVEKMTEKKVEKENEEMTFKKDLKLYIEKALKHRETDSICLTEEGWAYILELIREDLQ